MESIYGVEYKCAFKKKKAAESGLPSLYNACYAFAFMLSSTFMTSFTAFAEASSNAFSLSFN